MQSDVKNEFFWRYGPWAVVAGASEGLGAAYAEALAARNLNLVLVARRAGLLQDLAARLTRQYSVNILTLPLDLSDSGSFEKIAQGAQALQVGLFIYNAAFSVEGPFHSHSMTDHLGELNTNVSMPLRLIYHFGLQMLKYHRGGIILMSSLSAFQGSAYISNYSATKAFNLALAEGLWEEWRREGVDVLACAAGAIRTPNYESSYPRHTGRLSGATLEPRQVVDETLAALGRRPFVIPGRMNRLSSFVMRHLLPRRTAIRIMGSVLEGMYGPDPEGQKGFQ